MHGPKEHERRRTIALVHPGKASNNLPHKRAYLGYLLTVLTVIVVAILISKLNLWQQESIETSDKQRIQNNEPFSSVLAAKKDIHQFNRLVLLPRIKSLMNFDYFKYVRMNLNRPCNLWCNAEKCNLKDCKVKTVGDPQKCPTPIYDNELSTVNTDLSSEFKFFECYDDDDQDSIYIDLHLNPERYTGYSGESAHRVWRAIYEENCFIHQLRSPFDSDFCHEKRLFYEAISGLHSSITIHLCAEFPSSNSLMPAFEPNLNEFLRRFEGNNNYLENLYKLFQLELKALMKCKPYLLKKVRWPTVHTKSAVQDLLDSIDKSIDFRLIQEPISMFYPDHVSHDHVSHDLAIHFHNITTTIMDCVACDKCKLWGKVQLRGLGAAFKILSISDTSKLRLNNQEIVSMFNAIARLSHSLRQLENFKDLFQSKYRSIGD